MDKITSAAMRIVNNFIQIVVEPTIKRNVTEIERRDVNNMLLPLATESLKRAYEMGKMDAKLDLDAFAARLNYTMIEVARTRFD